MNDLSYSERWWAAVCYLCILVLIPIFFVKDKSPFLVRHCKQGFAIPYVFLNCVKCPAEFLKIFSRFYRAFSWFKGLYFWNH